MNIIEEAKRLAEIKRLAELLEEMAGELQTWTLSPQGTPKRVVSGPTTHNHARQMRNVARRLKVNLDNLDLSTATLG